MLRIFIVIVLCSILLSPCDAQNKMYRGAIGLQTGTMQYSGELGHDFYRFHTANPFTALSYSHYISSVADVRAGIAMGSWGYTNHNTQSFDVDVFNFNLDLKIKLINKDDPRFSPYVFGGIGFHHYSNWQLLDSKSKPVLYTNLGKPLNDDGIDGFQSIASGGAGVQIRFAERVFVTLEERLVFPGFDIADGLVGDYPDRMLMHTIGVGFGLFPWKDSDGDKVSDKYDKCPNTPSIASVDEDGCPLDADLDGVPDFEDQCVNVAGALSGKGCPDMDGDTVVDSEDKCPLIAGLIAHQGCPDADGDNIIDMEDECSEVKGLAIFKGCPDADSDGIPEPADQCGNTPASVKVDMYGCPVDIDHDGIADYQDKCPNDAGTTANGGCPEVKEEVKELFKRALNGIKFETGKDVIMKESFAILDTVVQVMVANPSYRLNIYGHTDNVGDPIKNLSLSEARANAVGTYLSSKGLHERILETKGFGDQKPIADNATKEGRKLNRRVEFVVEF